jgi:hypothetical protein
MKKLIKMYLKCIPRNKRPLRLSFLGKRLMVKQNNWLHFNNHPWDDKS